MANGEIEGKVEFFHHLNTANKRGEALAKSGKKVFLPASTLSEGFNGHRVFPKKGDRVVMRVIPMGDKLFAISWRFKPHEGEEK